MTDKVTGDNNARQRSTTKYNSSNNKVADATCRIQLPELAVLGKIGPNFNCPTQAIQPLTNVKATIDTAIENMKAEGSTVIPEGLAWAWRVLSPTEPFTQGKAYSDTKNVKAIVLLTDGENEVLGGIPHHNGSLYSAFGYAGVNNPNPGHLGTADGTQAKAQLDQKTTTLCNNIKAPGVGIKVYTIGFDVPASIKPLLEGCASATNMYYNSPSNEQLQTIFKDIALGLSNLRVSK